MNNKLNFLLNNQKQLIQSINNDLTNLVKQKQTTINLINDLNKTFTFTQDEIKQILNSNLYNLAKYDLNKTYFLGQLFKQVVSTKNINIYQYYKYKNYKEEIFNIQSFQQLIHQTFVSNKPIYSLRTKITWFSANIDTFLIDTKKLQFICSLIAKQKVNPQPIHLLNNRLKDERELFYNLSIKLKQLSHNINQSLDIINGTNN